MICPFTFSHLLTEADKIQPYALWEDETYSPFNDIINNSNLKSSDTNKI